MEYGSEALDTMRIKYFAYGSNMNPNRMEYRGADIYSMRPAVLNGFELVFNKLSSSTPGEGFANIQKKEGSVVEGILYETTLKGIRNLDHYEKYPREYDRTLFGLSHSGSENIIAFAYIAQPGRIAPYLKPRRNYLNHLLRAEGYLSADYFARLSSIITLD